MFQRNRERLKDRRAGEDHSTKLNCGIQLFNRSLEIAKKFFFKRYKMEMNLQFHLDDLSAPPESPSYYSSDEEMEVDVQSVEALGSSSNDSDIDVIACYRHKPIQAQCLVAGRAMTVDTSQCINDDYANFTWDDFDSMIELVDNQSKPLDMGAGPSTAAQSNSPAIKHCGNLTPSVDTPLSPPPSERGPTYSTFGYTTLGQQHPELQSNAHIQEISVRISQQCGQQSSAI